MKSNCLEKNFGANCDHYYVHPAAIVDSDRIGHGTRIWAYSHVMEGATIGHDCNLGDHCFVESGAFIGNNVTIKNGTSVWEGIRLEDGVFVGPGVVFTNDRYPRSRRIPAAAGRYATSAWLKPVRVKEGASLGASSTILAGVTVGEYSLVAAGAVVTNDVAPYALVSGSPARQIGWVCRCGCPLRWEQGEDTCRGCGLSFVERHGLIAPRRPDLSSSLGCYEQG